MNKALIRARSIARKLGVLSAMKAVHAAIFSHGYESRFDNALLSHINTGDRVWDVGANVGFYTAKFAEKVGPTGVVVAFEPVRECFDLLEG